MLNCQKTLKGLLASYIFTQGVNHLGINFDAQVQNLRDSREINLNQTVLPSVLVLILYKIIQKSCE